MPTPRVQPASKADNRTARKTLAFLGERLTTAQYSLHRAQRDRRTAQRHEAAARLSIRTITRRIQQEIDAHPALYPQARRAPR